MPEQVDNLEVGRGRISANLSSALKHTWRAYLHDNKRHDLEKAIWYLRRELGRKGAS